LLEKGVSEEGLDGVGGLTEAEYYHVDAYDNVLSVSRHAWSAVALGASRVGLVWLGSAHCDGWEELADSSQDHEDACRQVDDATVSKCLSASCSMRQAHAFERGCYGQDV
jgi:hypothetical protein